MEFCEIVMRIQNQWNFDIGTAMQILATYIENGNVNKLIERLEENNVQPNTKQDGQPDATKKHDRATNEHIISV